MSDPEGFLTRWSRRKLEAEPEQAPNAVAHPREVEDPATEPSAPDARSNEKELNPRTAGTVEQQPGREPEFDVTTLPSLESITAETDIRLFLQKGVPAQLTREALRRAWSADPNIRDFREIAENQWDFATGSDLPGFGSLDASAEDIRKMVADVFGEGLKPQTDDAQDKPDTIESAGKLDATSEETREPGPQDIAAISEDQLPIDEVQDAAESEMVHSNKVDVAMQHSHSHDQYTAPPTGRSRGRALPE